MFDHISHPQKRSFLAVFAEVGVVKYAAKEASVSRELHYDWLAKDPEYAAAFEEARRLAADALEDEAVLRAMTQKKSDKLLLTILAALKPEKYGRKVEHKHTGDVEVQHRIDLKLLSDEELVLLERISKRLTQSGRDRAGALAPEAAQDRSLLPSGGSAAEGTVLEAP